MLKPARIRRWSNYSVEIEEVPFEGLINHTTINLPIQILHRFCHQSMTIRKILCLQRQLGELKIEKFIEVSFERKVHVKPRSNHVKRNQILEIFS